MKYTINNNYGIVNIKLETDVILNIGITNKSFQELIKKLERQMHSGNTDPHAYVNEMYTTFSYSNRDSVMNVTYGKIHKTYNISFFDFKKFVSSLRCEESGLCNSYVSNHKKDEQKIIPSIINEVHHKDVIIEMSLDKNSLTRHLLNYSSIIIPYAYKHFHEQNESFINEGQTLYMVRYGKIFITNFYGNALHHQVSHMIEMQNLNRCLKDDWGLSFFMKEFSKEQRIIAFVRECRVRAIEAVLQNKTLDETIYHHPLLDRDLNRIIPFKKFKTEKEFREWHSHIFETTYKKYSYDRIEHDWKKRIDFIANHIE